MADEGATQRDGIGKAAVHGHLLRRLAPELQKAPRRRSADLFDLARQTLDRSIGTWPMPYDAVLGFPFPVPLFPLEEDK